MFSSNMQQNDNAFNGNQNTLNVCDERECDYDNDQLMLNTANSHNCYTYDYDEDNTVNVNANDINIKQQVNRYMNTEQESGVSTSEDSSSSLQHDPNNNQDEDTNDEDEHDDEEEEEEYSSSTDVEIMDHSTASTSVLQESILQSKGYIYHKKIAKTLQGEIFEAIDTNNDNQIVVIKKAIKELVNENITIRDGKKIPIQEDIYREIQIQKYLNTYQNENNNQKLPSEHIKLYEIFEDEDNIFVVTEHGGVDFFHWICNAHKAIEDEKISQKYWWKNIKYMFKQMVDYTLWLHQKMNICHLDISLENMLLKNGEYFYETGKFTYSQQIKFCDFGLAEYFDLSANPSFSCNKHVGKESYMAPEVYLKSESFDARKADSWSLGVILFVLMSGAPAYSKPDLKEDKSFQYIVYKQIPLLLQNWGRLHYCNDQILDLLNKIFVMDPKKRISVEQIRAHPFLL